MTWSAIWICSSLMSSTDVPRWRCATCGMRFAKASRTEDALRVANCSNAVPPESIRTMIDPTRYSPIATEATIEIPASKSEPNSRSQSFLPRLQRIGIPPTVNARNNGPR